VSELFGIPAGWRWVEFGEVARVASDLVDPKEYPDSPHVAPNHIESGTGRLLPYSTVSADGVESVKNRFKSGQILYSKIRPNLAKVAAVEFDGLCSADMYPINTSLHTAYLFRWMLTPEFTASASKKQGRNLLPKINVRELSSLPVPIPPPAEQARIAQTLDHVDALRTKRRTAIDLLDDLVQSIFVDMFGDPAVNPLQWPEVPMGELFKEKPNYGTMSPASKEGGEWLCLRVANIQGWNLDLGDRKYVDLESSTAAARHSVAQGDLLLARAIATEEHLGKAIVADPGEEKWAFDSHLMRIRLDASRVQPQYVRAFLRSPGGRKKFLAVTRRSAVQFNINTKEMAKLTIPVPPIRRQQDFLSALTAVDKLGDLHRKQAAELDTLFTVLQYRAFRGELWPAASAA
jgi:type I restriction enzyme S subunit